MKTYESQTALFARSAEKRRSGGAGNGGSHERERETLQSSTLHFFQIYYTISFPSVISLKFY